MSTDVIQLYGEEHFDSTYFTELKRFLSEHTFINGLEVGFAWGMSTMAFLETQPEARLTSVDMNDNMHKAKKISDFFGDRWRLIEGDSSTVLRTLNQDYDFIYIDGDHRYEGVVKDIKAAWPLLKPGGLMLFDDYKNAPKDVGRAVNEFVAREGLKLYEEGRNPNGQVYIYKEAA